MWDPLKKAGEAAVRTVRSLLAALVILALVAGTSWVVAAWQVTQERFERQRELDGLRVEFGAKLEQLTAAARAGGAGQGGEPGASGGGGQGGDAGGAGAVEFDAAFRSSVERRLGALEEAVRLGLGQKLEEEQRLALSLQVKTLLLKAKSEVLQVQLDLAEDNRGQARRELELAGATMAAVMAVAPAEAKADLTEVADLIDQARVDLLVGAPTGADRVSLAWHRLGELVGDFKGK
ncbi:MAG: hypothetical protein ACYC6V_04940 [Bacillota bacterium]